MNGEVELDASTIPPADRYSPQLNKKSAER
jgi:hypothetical protein